MTNGRSLTRDYTGHERREECAQGAAISVEVSNLKTYQTIQNGALDTIRKQLWALVILMLTTFLSAAGALAFMAIQYGLTKA